MAFLDTPWLDNQPNAQDAPDDGDGPFAKGLRSGITSAQGELHALAGGVGEAVGADDFARARYARSRELAAQAAREAPPVGALSDIHDLHSGYDWLAGTAGRLAPTAAVMLGAEALTRGRMPLTAATAATAPLETGAAIQAQQEDPAALKHSAGERLGTAAVTGTGAALAQNVVPVAMGGKLLGPAATVAKPFGRTVAANVGEAVAGNAVGAGAAEAIHQGGEMALNPDKTFDPTRIAEAAGTGAVVGVPFGIAGGAGEALRSAPGPAGTPLREKATDAFKGLFNRDSSKDETTARAVASDRPIEPMPAGTDPAAFAAQNDAKATSWAAEKLKGWINDAGLDEATKQRYADLLQRVADPAARTEVGAIALGKSALQKAKAFRDRMAEKAGDLTDAAKETMDTVSDTVKSGVARASRAMRPEGSATVDGTATRVPDVPLLKSEDFSGVRKVIAQEIVPALQKAKPELLQNPEGISTVADAIRMYLQHAEAGKPIDAETNAMLRSFLGEETVPVMQRVVEAIDADPKASERMYAALNELHTHFGSEDELRSTVIRGLVDKKGLTRDDITSAVDQLKNYASGRMFNGMGDEKRAFFEKRVQDELAKTFGNNKEKVLEAFQAHHEATKPKSDADVSVARTNDEGDLEDAKNAARGEGQQHTLETDNPPEFEPPRFYGAKDNDLILSHDAHVRDHLNEHSQASRLIARARAENPDRNVEFMKAGDYARERGMTEQELHDKTNGRPDDYGVVVAHGQKQEGRITEAEAQAMRADTGYKNNKSRIDTDKHPLDAIKITRDTLAKLPQIEGESNMRRTARAFSEGLASALIHFDAKVKDLPDSLVIARRNGTDVTLGALKKAKLRDPLIDTRDLASDIMDAKRMVAKAREAGDTAKADALKEKLEELQRREYGQLMNEGKNSETDLERAKRDMGVYDIANDAEIHFAAAEHEKKGTLRHKVSNEGASTLKKAEPAAKPAQPSEHVPAAERGVKDDAKDIMAGAANAEALIDRYTKGVAEARGGQKIGADGKTADYNVGTSYKGNTAKGEAASPIKMRKLVEEINNLTPKNRRERQNANEAIDRLNTAIGEALKKSPDAAYEMKLKSAQRTDAGTTASDTSREHIEKYVKDVLGDKVRVEWVKTMHAGEYEHNPGKAADQYGPAVDPSHVIRVSVHSLDPMGTAFHESLHAFFQHLRDQKSQGVMKVLYRAADTPSVMNQLRKLLKDSPEAIKQIEKSREERVAYMYQFYAKEQLRLGPETKNVFQRLKDFFLKTLGMWTNDQRAEHIMDYFHEGSFAKDIGDRNAVQKALMEQGRNQSVEYLKAVIAPLKKIETAVLGTGSERLRDTYIPAFQKLADMIQPAHAGEAHDVGFLQASSNAHKSRMNSWIKSMKDLTEDELFKAHELLRGGIPTGAQVEPNVMRGVRATRDLMQDMLKYMRDAGVDVGSRGPDYFPRVWDPEFISRHQDEFKAMLEKYKLAGKLEGDPEKIMNTIMTREGTEDGVVVDMPGMQHAKRRVLDFITNEDAAKFTEKNFLRTVGNYVMQGARRAEWARRFGDDNAGLKKIMDAAKKDGASEEEVELARSFVRGIDGTLGDDLNPTARRFIGNMLVYQNVRLLPLAIFSSFIDSGGIVVRGGTWGDAFKAFKRGIVEIPRGFSKNAKDDEWHVLAKDIGAIDDAALVHALGTSYTQGMVSDFSRKVNDSFFKYNLMEQYNMSMRVAATEAATRFMARHATGKASEHSERWLAELGYKPNEIKMKDGRPLIHAAEFEAAGMSPEAAAAASNKMKGALNRWVDGAILRPNAADKPIWMNDPRWALVAHLKQFTYAFHHTILARAFNEASYGNYGPGMALLSYVPMMMAADYTKGLIQGGGEQPDWKKNWGAADYLQSGWERAGLNGVGQYSADFVKGIRQGGPGIDRVMGPTIEQMYEGLKTLTGHEMYSTMAVHSMPANALYSHAFHEPSTDPTFAD